MGKTFKAIIAASAAAVKAGFPGGESPGEAYKRVFDAMTKSDNAVQPTILGDDIVKSTVTNVEGNTTETTYKTDTINNFGKDGENGQSVVNI
mgnify:CR=1 FL=1